MLPVSAVQKEAARGEDTMMDPKTESVQEAEARNLYQPCHKEIAQILFLNYLRILDPNYFWQDKS